jgi:glycosyltransferase involved in cell wall biosynthesis
MRLGIVYLVYCDYRDGVYMVNAPFARYVEALLPYVDALRLMLPVSWQKRLERADYPLTNHPKIEVVELPPIYHLKDYFRDKRKHWSILNKGIADCDLVNVRLPNFLGLLAGELCLKQEKPFFISLVGDYSGVISGEKYSSLKKILGNIILSNHEKRLKNLLGKAYTLVNGRGLYEKYNKFAKKMEIITTTTVLQENFHEREDTCRDEQVRVITVAVMQGYKGIPQLIDAAAILKGKGRKVIFDLLGTGSRLETYKSAVNEKGLENVVLFHGYIPYGPKLFEFYRQADIFVLPSIGAEGTPRVLIEAMSQSLPVITTKVGGTPWTIEDGVTGLLIEPGNPEAIANAVERVINDTELRKRLIHKGFERAHDFTFENHSRDLFMKLSAEFPGMFRGVSIS